MTIQSIFRTNRKLKLTLIYFLSVTLMLVFNKIDATSYIDFLKWSLGLYAGSNAISKLGNKKTVIHNHKDTLVE